MAEDPVRRVYYYNLDNDSYVPLGNAYISAYQRDPATWEVWAAGSASTNPDGSFTALCPSNWGWELFWSVGFYNLDVTLEYPDIEMGYETLDTCGQPEEGFYVAPGAPSRVLDNMNRIVSNSRAFFQKPRGEIRVRLVGGSGTSNY